MSSGSRKYMPTYIIVSLNVSAYVCTSLLGGNFIQTDEYLLVYYGQVNYLVLGGWYWQLFTAIFIHVNLMHLLGNMLFLLIFGLRAEELFSVKEYLLIYFLSGLAGNVLTLLVTLLAGYNMISAGASGAIFGLFGACIVYFRRTIGQSMIGALAYAFFLLMISSGPNVNNLAHIGGLVIGLLIGYSLATTRKTKAMHQYNYSFSTES